MDALLLMRGNPPEAEITRMELWLGSLQNDLSSGELMWNIYHLWNIYYFFSTVHIFTLIQLEFTVPSCFTVSLNEIMFFSFNSEWLFYIAKKKKKKEATWFKSVLAINVAQVKCTHHKYSALMTFCSSTCVFDVLQVYLSILCTKVIKGRACPTFQLRHKYASSGCFTCRKSGCRRCPWTTCLQES